MSNPIVTENMQAGTTAWHWTSGKTATTQIQAYCDKTSYNPGDTVMFYASTQVAGTGYSIAIYRLGWYDSRGGRLIATINGLTGVAQGYWDAGASTLNNCPSAIINSTTHLLETGWTASATWAIPANLPTGVYVAQFTDANGFQTYTTFVVKGNATADYVVVLSHMTSAAYNDWGGYSLYTNPTVGVQVSMNRPDVNGLGTGHLFLYDVCLIKWLERQGYNLSYISDVDLHVGGASLLSTYKALIIDAHCEYWTYEMRGAVETALASGLGIGYLGTNACYWQARLSADNASHANRTVTCYKVDAGSNNYALDPMYGVDNTRVTTRWRDAFLNRPENAFLGIMYSSFLQNKYFPWTVDSSASSPFLSGTGLVPGQTYGIDQVSIEYDKAFAGGPSNLVILATSPLTDANNVTDVSNTAYYYHSSGALVFAAGNASWTLGLDEYRWSYKGAPLVVSGMQRLLANVMPALLTARGGQPPKYTASFAFHQ